MKSKGVSINFKNLTKLCQAFPLIPLFAPVSLFCTPRTSPKYLCRYEMKENSLKDAVKLIAEKYNLNKNEVYKKALELKND